MINKKIIFLIFAILFLQINFIISLQETQFLEQSTDIGVLMGLDEGQIIGQGVEYYQSPDKNTQLTFSKADAEVDVNGNKFANIVPQDQAKHPSFIELDKDGNPVKADFTVNENGGKYIFGNTQIDVPPNSRVFFDKETGVKIKAAEGAEFTQNPTNLGMPGLEKHLTTIEGDNYKLSNGAVISGKLGFDNGQAFVPKGDSAIINGVELTSKLPFRQINVFFDGQKHEGDYASFDLANKNLILSTGNGQFSKFNFKEGNPFLEINKGTHFNIEHNGEIEIRNRANYGLDPLLTVTKPNTEGGAFFFEQGDKKIIILSRDANSYKQTFFGGSSETRSRSSSQSIISVEKNPFAGNIGTWDKPLFSPMEIIVSSEHGILFDNSNKLMVYVDDRTLDGSNLEDNAVLISSLTKMNAKSRVRYNNPSEEILNALNDE